MKGDYKKIRIKVLVKILTLYYISVMSNHKITIEEIMAELNCSRSNAYNYLRAVEAFENPDGNIELWIQSKYRQKLAIK
jgi:hypothetical protein